MKGVSCLQDLKSMLKTLGFEVESYGWYLTSVHGNWGMIHGEVLLNGAVIRTVSEAPIPKKEEKIAKVKTITSKKVVKTTKKQKKHKKSVK